MRKGFLLMAGVTVTFFAVMFALSAPRYDLLAAIMLAIMGSWVTTSAVIGKKD